jgi:hypothetical protein
MLYIHTVYLTIMKDRETITYERLRELSRNNPTPETLELLWEIHRLQKQMREYLQFVEYVRRMWATDIGGTLVGIEAKRYELLKEPCTSEIYWKK